MLGDWVGLPGCPDLPQEATLTEITQVWQHAFQPSGLWGDIRQFIRHEADRAAWSDALVDQGGSMVHCRIAPLRGGHTIVWFIPGNAGLGAALLDEAWPGDDVHRDAAPASEPERGEGVA
jgi:hypothetical protein